MNKNKILLVYPPNQLMPIETPRPDGSLGLLYLASQLESVGFCVDVIDMSVGIPGEDLLEDTFYNSVLQDNGLIRIGMTLSRIEAVLEKGQYGLIGINSNFTPQTKMVLEVAMVVKKVNPDILVVVGGVNGRNLVDRFLFSGFVDLVCLGEGEKIFTSIAKSWIDGYKYIGPGVAYKQEKDIVRVPVEISQVAIDLDTLPIPAWHKLPFYHYDNIASPHGVISDAYRYAPIMTSRGCPFKCAYCHISKEKSSHEAGPIGSLRLKSIDRVMIEVDILVDLGVRRLYFEDDSLLAKKARVKQIFGQVADRGLKVADVNGVNLVHLTKKGSTDKLEVDIEYLEILKHGGFDQIVFPVESGCQRILDVYATGKLNLTRMPLIQLVKAAVKLGISCPVNMMIGFPDETETEMKQSIDLARELVSAGATYCTFFIPIPFPGSLLYNIAISGGYLKPDFDTDSLNWKNAVMENTVVPPEKIIDIRDCAWIEVNTAEHIQMRQNVSAGTRIVQ